MKTRKQKKKNESKEVQLVNPQEQLEATEGSMLLFAYHKKMMDSLPFMVWLKDKDGKILAGNTRYAESAGIADSRGLAGKTDFDLWPKKLAKGYVEDDLKVIQSGEPTILVEQIKNKDGDLYWAETYKCPVDIKGEIVGTLGYARDVSEQKELYTEISKKELEYSTLVKNIPLCIIRYDKDCKRIFLDFSNYGSEKNEEMQKMIGKSPIELWDPSIVSITAEAYQNKLKRVLQTGEQHLFEMQSEINGNAMVKLVSLLPEVDERNDVVGILATTNDVTEISKYRHNLENLAYHDALTSLPNRTLLNQRLHVAAAGERFGLMFMDLDLFKTINDTMGHAVGDSLLIDAAKRISASVREDDTVARIGGDEFAILVEGLKSDEDLDGLATKIAKKLSAPFDVDGISFFVTASIGIACFPSDSEDVEDLIKYADTAMYEAKKLGRNNHQFYTPVMMQQAMEHLAIATALRYAIPKNELHLLYQPKVDIETREIIGAESLLRWQGGVLGQIPPDKFIPVAEEGGLIVQIGEWVLRKSCEATAQLNQGRKNPLNIAVNVSSKEFVGTNFIRNLKKCLQETGCKPEWLTIEITESLLLNDKHQALETLIAIDEMGIILSIDDFGTGYSALAYLSKFPIRQVKIDRSFVIDICELESAATLIKAIIAMTLSLGKGLVAEGVETKEQAALIKEYGCHDAQGYLYSKPIPFSQLIHLVEQQKTL